MCYTFNNYPQGMNQYLNHVPNPKNGKADSNTNNEQFLSSLFNFRPIESTTCSDTTDAKFQNVKKVTGCGKKSGLQLIIDSQKMNNLFSENIRSKGYYVFVTVPGVVTSKLPFYVNTEFDGEHNFYLHGIHFVTVSISNCKT